MMITLLSLLACSGAPEPTPAPNTVDLVVTGHLHDGTGAPARAATLLVDDGRIVEIAGQTGWEDRAGPETRRLEATWITPGFVDAHAHPLGLGRRMSELDLTGAPSYADTLTRIAAAKPDPSGWIRGRGWDQNDWPDAPEGSWPRADDLQPLGEVPIALRRVDGHAVWVSHKVLADAGITAETPDPEGGRIVRDAQGNPTGVLIDTAMDLVKPPQPSQADRARWLSVATDAMLQSGLVGTHVMGADDATIKLLLDTDARGELPVRLWVYASPDSDAAQRMMSTGPWGDGRVRVVGVKAFADGALGSRGALLSADYADEPGHRGLAVMPATELNELAVRLLGAGSQLAVHAIGDAGVSRVLDAFALAREAHPGQGDVPLRVEHAQVVHPDDVPRFARLGAVASMQPTHATSDMPWAEKRLGAERIHWAYAWQTLRGAGALLALGSDFPVEEVQPALGIWSATTRTDQSGAPNGGWMPDQRLSVEQTVMGFTSGAAAAVGAADRFGTIAVGRKADLSLWTVTDGPGAQRWVPAGTIVDGRVQWAPEVTSSP